MTDASSLNHFSQERYNLNPEALTALSQQPTKPAKAGQGRIPSLKLADLDESSNTNERIQQPRSVVSLGSVMMVLGALLIAGAVTALVKPDLLHLGSEAASYVMKGGFVAGGALAITGALFAPSPRKTNKDEAVALAERLEAGTQASATETEQKAYDVFNL